MEWELIRVGKTEWNQDASEVYTLINWRPNENDVRLDVMNGIDDTPMVSFVGHPNDVRKTAMQWLDANVSHVSPEHGSYIGSELTRALFEQTAFVQD